MRIIGGERAQRRQENRYSILEATREKARITMHMDAFTSKDVAS